MGILGTIFRKARQHGWVSLLVFTVCIWLFPVGYRITRVILIASTTILWILGAILLRKRKLAAYTIIIVGLLALAWLCLPGNAGDPSVLRRSYVQSLKQYEGTLYIWGGENRVGIDCSGLVRRGLINANIKRGFVTLNPKLIRTAIALWWNDCSALALREGYRGVTKRVLRAQSLNSISAASLMPGDLAVTANGVHVLAYLGGNTWIEADPGKMKVISVQVPSDNIWFTVPVQIVRWTQLQETPNR